MFAIYYKFILIHIIRKMLISSINSERKKDNENIKRISLNNNRNLDNLYYQLPDEIFISM